MAQLQHSGICQISISNHALLVCPRFLAYAASPSVGVLAQYMYTCMGDKSGHNALVYYMFIKVDRGYHTRYHTRYAAAYGTLRPAYAYGCTQGHPNGVQARAHEVP